MNASNRRLFSLSTSRAVCYRMIDRKKGLELLNEKALKEWTSGAGTLISL